VRWARESREVAVVSSRSPLQSGDSGILRRVSELQPKKSGGVPQGGVCIMGARGLLGTALQRELRAQGVEVTAYGRGPAAPAEGRAHWDPAADELDREPLSGAHAVINLAGEDLSAGRWTARRKQALRKSRVGSTDYLARALAQLPQPPEVLVNASAVGFYGDRGDDAVDEDSPAGHGFLAELCADWEAATEPASAAGIRVVTLRYGVVLTPEGGALAKMLPAFRMGVGGRLGSGNQRFPWVSLTDAVAATLFVIEQEQLRGPVNVVAPESINNRHFTRLLGRTLKRPTVLPVPAFALRMGLGQMAEDALLVGANVRPRRLEVVGFRFEYPRIEDALGAMLGVD